MCVFFLLFPLTASEFSYIIGTQEKLRKKKKSRGGVPREDRWSFVKTKVLPLRLVELNDRERGEYQLQMRQLQQHYGDVAEFLPTRDLGEDIPPEADAVVFPKFIGSIFEHKNELSSIQKPILALTSEFGTVEMWDWEVVTWMRENVGLNVFTPYTVELGKVVLRAISARNQMKNGMKFLMFQDDPGEGMQAYIFKRFYWWSQESTRQIEDAFGIQMVYRSWKEVNQMAQLIPDEEALALWEQRKANTPVEGVPLQSILRAVKIYIAVKQVIDQEGNVGGVGANCLNESFSSNTTPCLAWDWIFEYDHIIWACEGDTITLLSVFVLYSALQKPIMMTNIYPFLVGMAALKHEKIQEFPDIPDPDNHALGVHCGYFGFVPQSFCTQWAVRPKVLEIVNDEAIVIDARMATGPIVMAKLHADMHKLTIIEAEIEDYVQYPGSDCRNGALIRYRNHSGHKVMEALSSHHAILIQGDVTHMLRQLAKVYGFEVEVI